MTCLNCFCLSSSRGTENDDDDDGDVGSSKVHVFDRFRTEKDGFRRFRWKEIEKVGYNFSKLIGEGGFSNVYLATFSSKDFGALKVYFSSERLSQMFKQELEVLRNIRHENIVKFMGYCDEGDGGVLVFEYISNGSLHEKLHALNEKDQVLPWSRRISIAYQLAKAVEYLHDNCSYQIIHGDIKSSNILLDNQLNCKLCDFGFAKMGFSSTVIRSPNNQVMGSPGYVDPHYLRTGIISKKNDVYSFGVLILELITGIEAFCTEKEQLLSSITRPKLKDSNKILELIDRKLNKKFDVQEAVAMASIADVCLCDQPSSRPSMAEIAKTIKEKMPSVFSP